MTDPFTSHTATSHALSPASAAQAAREAAVAAVVVAVGHHWEPEDPAVIETHALRLVDAIVEAGPDRVAIITAGLPTDTATPDEVRMAVAILATWPSYDGSPPDENHLRCARQVITELAQR